LRAMVRVRRFEEKCAELYGEGKIRGFLHLYVGEEAVAAGTISLLDADDVIKSAGHLISPFEIESSLMTHPAVAQAGVIGVPDPIAGQAVKAFVELKDGVQPSEELRRSLLAHARRLLGAVVAPREIAFAPALPRTRSGKIMRRLLRARELGLPEGDLSTLEAGT